MTFRPELIDELLQEYRNPEDLMGEGGIFKQLTKALIERCLSAELDTHLAEERVEPEPDRPKNRRNGQSKKTIKGEFGEAEIGIPRDRNGAFEPQLIAKGQTRFNGFDDKILSLCARGMTTRDIQAQLQELYGWKCPTPSFPTSPKPSSKSAKFGRIAAWMPFIPSFTLTLWWSKCGMKVG
jgi:transposase-like protein